MSDQGTPISRIEPDLHKRNDLTADQIVDLMEPGRLYHVGEYDPIGEIRKAIGDGRLTPEPGRAFIISGMGSSFYVRRP